MKAVPAPLARAAIAAHVLADDDSPLLGDVVLMEHQRVAVARLRRMIAESGGALLADDVGLGKTFVALALAATERDPVVVAPAAVRDQWLASAGQARVAITFCSMEMLSRGVRPARRAGFVVVDEAHHLRNRNTRRFAEALRLCGDARVLLLSATPVQNRLTDLRAILALFLGSSAHALPEHELTRHVLRRAGNDIGPSSPPLPVLDAPMWLEPVQDVDCLDRILALPPPVPPWDGGDGGVLVTWTLVRQWASSRAALCAALRRRLARGLAMADALRAGRRPSEADLARWCYAEGVQQLAFAELLDRTADGTSSLLPGVEAHVAAVRALLSWLATTPDPDVIRAARIRDLRARRPGGRMVLFSEYAETVTSLYRALAPDGAVAMLTHRGGRVASGGISRGELLAQFARGAGARTPGRVRADLLFTTDVLSEGIELPDASAVVHLDLAWNPARLEQRAGRLRRLHSPHHSVGVFLMPPPAPAERMLELERRLRRKRAIASRAVGVAGTILPGPAPDPAQAAIGAREPEIVTLLHQWSRPDAPSGFVVAAVAASAEGAIACVRFDGRVRLVAVADGCVTTDRTAIHRACSGACGADAPMDPGAAGRARALLERWLANRATSGVVDLGAMHLARTRRAVLRRVDGITRRLPRHARPNLAPLLRAARGVATATFAGGAERVLDELAAADMPDDAWLQAVSEFGALNARQRRDAGELLALLLLHRQDGAGAP